MPSSIGKYRGVDINPGAQNDIIAQMANIDASTPKPVAAITPQDLSRTSTAIAVPQPQIPTGTASFQGEMDAFIGSLQAKAADAKKAKDVSGSAYADKLFNSDTELSLQSETYSQDDGVDQRKAELDDINQQLLQEQEGLRRTVENIENNSEGLSRSGVMGKIDEARRQSLRTQADLAVVQLAKQGRYDSAKAIADRFVAASLEKQRQNLETLRFIYEENKEQFSKDDARAFETAQGERERKLQNEEYRLRAEFDQKIRQQDPLYQAQLQGARLANQKLQKEIGTNYDMEITQEQFDQLPSMDQNNMTLLQLMSNPKITAGNRTVIGAGLSLARAAQDLAGANPDADFAGLYPFRGLVDVFTPKGFKREKTVSNEAALNALNLQTQFWASGAALTEEQTKYVLGLVPTKSDTDKHVKTKLNTLANYMMAQTSAKLMTDGVNFKPAQVNLFETSDMLSEASEEQIAELRAIGALP